MLVQNISICVRYLYENVLYKHSIGGFQALL